MACQTDLAGLPLLSGCPADNEWVLVGNAVGGLDINGQFTIGYARRLWGDLRKCAVGSIKFKFTQFIIGQPGSLMNPGDTQLVLNFAGLGITSIIQDSVFITLDSGELPRENTDRLSYGVVYNSGDVTINLEAGVTNGQLYVLHYAYTN